ncbi:HAD-IA family hydrolase [Rhodococcus sp. B50]|uniref:HAD-IA family hydrolase n=1 Tax=Rhodococcus sp. B50 TaxID=2682847 RepID=UPI0027DB9E14|nr:HAD-IA family hydrolase [Rhodococcus sp. B50]MBS9371332.1 Alpha-D-glucose 1-phosphate phosphatase YihX [Rhodococcus sp. B50]
MLRGLVLDVGGVLVGPGSDPGTFGAVVALLRPRGVRTALLSNDPGGPGAQWLRDLEGAFVDRVVLSGDAGVAKPEPESYLLVARLLDLGPGECVFVDDAVGNVRGAAAAGMVGVHHDGSHDASGELAVLFDLDPEEIGSGAAAGAEPWWRCSGGSGQEGERGR